MQTVNFAPPNRLALLDTTTIVTPPAPATPVAVTPRGELPRTGGTPWLPIALSLAIVLTLTVASATQLRRLRTRRRAARAAS